MVQLEQNLISKNGNILMEVKIRMGVIGSIDQNTVYSKYGQ